jgi:enediyne biosynthesis protein E4
VEGLPNFRFKDHKSSVCQHVRSLLLWALLSASGLLLLSGCHRETPSPAAATNTVSGSISQGTAAQLAQIEAREQHINETTWSKEMLAEDCGRVIESFWDSLNASSNKLELAAAFPLDQIILGQWDAPESFPHGIKVWKPTGATATLSPAQWRQFVEQSTRAGWKLVQTEFRHNRFDTDDAGRSRESQFYFSAHLTNSVRAERAAVEGTLIIDWEPTAGGNTQPAEAGQVTPTNQQARVSAQAPAVKQIDASGLRVWQREGDPPFQPILTESMLPVPNSRSIDPLILYDLDGDGLSEIILAGENLVYHRREGGRYEAQPLCKYPPGVIYSALIADFDGDGAADFLCEKLEGLVLYKGSPQGTFEQPGRLVWAAARDMKAAMVLTCGDIDHDGDLDVFLAQYRMPYSGGQMPAPYYDANDGFPAYLLLNDGHGNFTDATVAAGLDQKRWRRTYSASFVDLDADGHLDLVVVSDFAGIDVYRNDGHGHFADMTRQWIPDPHAFGMADAFADFNSDGRLDLLMIGMPSPTVDRLEHLHLWRPDAAEDRSLRSRMSFGNRLYVARTNAGFEQTALGNSIARSGWSWGCSAFDFDNDGFPDVYIANGMESRTSVQEYEGEFWLHDAYVGNSSGNPAVDAYLRGKVTRLRSHGGSYGGYEKNRFFLNQAGTSFIEVAHLFGVALELDSRNVVSDDLDGDGRMDLVVTSYEPWPGKKQTLRVYRNALTDGGNWIGFRFREEGQGRSPVGAQVTIHYDGRGAVGAIVAGDSHRSQHANTIHFGLGSAQRVDNVEIRWPTGRVTTLAAPAINRYHLIRQRPEEP